MSRDSTGYLAFGIDLGNPEEWDDDNMGFSQAPFTVEEMEKLQEEGHWDDTYDEDWEPEDFDDEDGFGQGLMSAWFVNFAELYRLRLKLPRGSGENGFLVTVEAYSYGDNPSYMVVVKETLESSGDRATKLDMVKLLGAPEVVKVEDKRKDLIWDFCQVMHIKFDRPQWLLVASWE